MNKPKKKSKLLTLPIVIFYWLSAIPIHAFEDDFWASKEPNPKNYTVSIWNNTNGIPHNTIYALEKDLLGYTWLATEEGLTRFDGSSAVVFEPSNSPELIETSYYNFFSVTNKGIWAAGDFSLVLLNKTIKQVIDCRSITTSSWLTAVSEDRNGGLWIGTKEGKVFLYENGSFTLLDTWKNLTKDPINSLLAKGDQLWIGTDSGLFLYNSKNGTVEKMAQSPEKIRYIIQTGKGIVLGAIGSGIWNLKTDHSIELIAKEKNLTGIDYRSLRSDKEGRIWAGTEKGEILLIDNDQVNHFYFPELAENPIRKLLMESNHFFVGTQSKGLMVFKESLIQKFEHPLLSKKNIRPIFQVVDGSIWIGTRNNGVFRIKDGKTTAFDASKGLVHEGILSLYGDDNNMYIGTREGLYRIELKSNTLSEDYHLSQAFPRYQVNTITKDKEGKIWFATSIRRNFLPGSKQ